MEQFFADLDSLWNLFYFYQSVDLVFQYFQFLKIKTCETYLDTLLDGFFH